MKSPDQIALELLNDSDLVIDILKIGGKRWRRNVAKGARIGPWLPSEYKLVNKEVWEARMPCMYFLVGNDSVIKYVGISRNRLKDRWRTSPAFDVETMEKLPNNQLFHSQCWKFMENEIQQKPDVRYQVRCISGQKIISIISKVGAPLTAFLVLGDDIEGIVAGVERWLCNNQNPSLVPWNVAMTG